MITESVEAPMLAHHKRIPCCSDKHTKIVQMAKFALRNFTTTIFKKKKVTCANGPMNTSIKNSYASLLGKIRL